MNTTFNNNKKRVTCTTCTCTCTCTIRTLNEEIKKINTIKVGNIKISIRNAKKTK
jgi:hypothetical protein